jgi:hypothetical protein
MDQKISIELRLNNTVFLCQLDGKMYNIKDTKLYAVSLISGITPHQGQVMMNAQGMIICEKCYNDNKGDKGLKLQEPSPIVAVPPGAIQQIKRGPKN